MHRALPVLFLLLSLPALADSRAPGKRIVENIPEIAPALSEGLQRYENTRAASPAGWAADGSGMLITTRFGSTTQVHRVKAPGAAREQLTFFDEPVRSVVANPKCPGFVFGRDSGGSEFWQLYWFDLTTREVRLLTDGKSRNASPVWSPDGRRLAYSSTARNGKDTDVWVLDLDGATPPRAVVTEGGSWSASGFSPDGRELLVRRYVSIADSRPGVVTLADGALKMLPIDGGKAAFGAMAFSPDGRGVYYTSDEESEFLRLRYHDIRSRRAAVLGGNAPWDVQEFAVSPDGTRVAFVRNEDGYGALHLLDGATHAELPLPAIPRGVVSGLEFSGDGKRLAFGVNAPTSPGDAYSIDLASNTLSRWTESEVGGLDRATFVQPELVRFPTFDRDKGRRRTIPAFYYRPARAAADAVHPVVIQIHGGPEGQARPTFSADIQYLVNVLGVAVLVPNVRGSSGYGKRWLALDNGRLREDSVKDIGALLDWIARRPELDASRVAVYGGSYGGYMVLATMARYSDRLRAGIDIVGISNFVTFLENTESYRRDLRRAEYGDERDPEMRAFLEKISPTTNAHRIRIPLFVAQGANDPRVPASEAAQIVDTVRANGGEVWFLQFPDEGHGFRKKANVDFFRAAVMQFWKEKLIGG